MIRPGRFVVALSAATVVTAFAIAVLFAAPANADETDPAPTSTPESAVPSSAESALAEKFAPVVSLVEQTEACGPGEPYQPSDVDVMFDNPSVALRGPWTSRDLVKAGPSVQDVAVGLPGYALDLPGSPLDPECTYEKWANAQWGKKSEPTVYARVATQSGKPGRLALQFFLFYPFNDYNNKHETDWERIQLEFAATDATEAFDQTPVRVVYSQHYGAEYANWGETPRRELEISGGTHPVVFVSAGSHANQFSSGVFMGNNAELGFGCDSTAGDQVAVEPVVKTIPTDAEAAAAEFPWTTYLGHWGEVGPRRFYEGPTGPNRKVAWNRPFTWADGARSSSVEVPGSSVIGSRVTETYCTAVGTGSDLFRRYVQSPGAALLALAAALIAMRWLLRRTSWETDPLPVRQWRSAGQIATAAWRLFRRHVGLFLMISAPMILVTVAATAVRGFGFVTGMPWWWQWITIGIGLAALLASAAATVRAIARIDAGEEISATRAYATSWRRAVVAAPPMIVAGIITVFCFGSLVLVPVALALLTGWTLMVPLIVLGDVAGFRAWWRSLRLAAGSWRSIAPVALLGALLLLSVGALLAALIFVVYPAPFAVLNAVPPLMFALLWPLIVIASTYALATAESASAQDRDADLVEPR